MLKLVTAKRLRGFLVSFLFLIPILAHAQKPGSFYWGDSDMDGIISGNDYATLVSVYMDNSQDDAGLYFGYPQSRYRQDLDGDGLISGADISFLESWFVGDWNTYGAPASLEWAGESVGLTIDPADTVGISISAISYSSAGAGHWPRTGFGIIFAIDPTSQCASTAQIYGFDPVGGETVWDWRNPLGYDYQPTLQAPENGIASVKLRATGCTNGQVIRVKAYIPGDMEYLIPGQRNPARLTVSSPTILEITVSTGDTTPPETTITSQPLNPSNSADASFEFTCNEASCTFECQIDSGGFASCPSPQSYLSLSDGSHTFEVQAIDNSNNIDPTPAIYAWTIDTIPPETTITYKPAPISNRTWTTFAFTSSDPACTFECKLDVDEWAACTSPQEYSGLAEGSHTFQVRARDSAGNYDQTPASYPWIVDITPPVTTITSGPPEWITPADAAIFIFSCNETCTFECQVHLGMGFTWPYDCSSPEIIFEDPSWDVFYSFNVHATDQAGNRGDDAYYYWRVVELDTQITSYPSNPASSSTADFMLYCENFLDCDFECQLDAGPWTPCEPSVQYTGLAVGAHTFSARAGRTAVYFDPTPATYSWNIQLHDVWVPTTAAIPDKAVWHDAIWTGVEMIVWGGVYYSGVYDYCRYNPGIDSWGKISSIGEPTPREGSSLVWTGTEMIVWGGLDDGGNDLNDGARYDPVLDSWLPISSLWAPGPRSYHSAIWTGTEMIIWGGHYDDGYPDINLNDGGRYDPATNSWIAATSLDGAPAARELHTAVWTGSEMIVWGGCLALNYYCTSTTNTGGRYNPTTDSWTATSTINAPDGRIEFPSVFTGTEMIVWGGWYFDAGYQYLNSGARYNPVTDSWTPTSVGANVPSARAGHSAVWTGIEMIIWGGIADSLPTLADGAKYNPVADSWAPISLTNAPLGTEGHSAIWTGTEMIVWGGCYIEDYPSIVLAACMGGNSGGRYNPATDSWNPTFRKYSPEFKAHHTTGIWTGTEMIIWGFGFDCPGHKYNPTTDNWEKISSINAPSYRENYTAVWTGQEMIIWGGGYQFGDTVYVENTGGRYNPATDSWAATSIVNAPSPRWSHTAIWSGTEMIVWGGYSENTSWAFNTGGRYDPATDSWTATSVQNVPPGATFHTAVWTGTEMIVWGGQGLSGYLNTGGAYKPSTDHWNPTPTNGAPSARQHHTAVWDGTQMIIWGGYGSGYLNDGARLKNNTWTPLSLVNAPTARYKHSAVWTGTEMIIWAGQGGSNTGARYNPVTDSWTATTLVNAPVGRIDFPAVWAGNQMIIWGGDNGSAYLNTGGRYFP